MSEEKGKKLSITDDCIKCGTCVSFDDKNLIFVLKDEEDKVHINKTSGFTAEEEAIINDAKDNCPSQAIKYE